MKKINSLSAKERIKSIKLFDQLLSEGSVIRQTPFRLTWCAIPYNDAFPVRIAVTVSKRNIAEANKRNRTKRIMREAYRLNKQELIEWARRNKKGLALLFIAQVKAPPDFLQTQEKIILLLHRLMQEHAVTDQ